MLPQLPDRLVRALPRLKNQDEFRLLCDYLMTSKWWLAEQACNTQGVTSDEFSGAYKAISTLLSAVSLEEFLEPPFTSKRFE